MGKMNTTRFERIKKQVKEGNISDEQCHELISLLIVRVGASDIENTSSSIQPALSLIPNDIPHEWKLALTKQAHREGFSSGYYEAWQIGNIIDTTKRMIINMAMENDDDQFELIFLGSELATRLAVIAGHINSVPEHFKLSRPTKDNSVILPYRREDVGKITGLVGELTTQHDALFRKTMNNIEIIQKEGILPQHEIKSQYDVTILVRDNVMSLVEEAMRVASGLKSLISGQDDGTELRDACKQVSVDNEQVFAWRDSFSSPGRSEGETDETMVFKKMINDHFSVHGTDDTWNKITLAVQNKLKGLEILTDAQEIALEKLESKGNLTKRARYLSNLYGPKPQKLKQNAR